MRTRSWWWVVAAGSVLGCGAGPEAVGPEPLRDGAEVHARMEAAWGTREVKQVLPPGRTPGTRLDKEPRPELLTDVAGTLYFVVQEEDQRIALWKSDGTTAGTVVVKAFPPTNAILGGLRIGRMTPVGSRLFFHCFEPALGWELWVSDGTEGGTRPVADLTPGPGDSGGGGFSVLNGSLSFFRNAPAGQGGTELWHTDGTAAGTVRVMDFGRYTTPYGDVLPTSGTRVFLTEDFEESVRLWRTDGTAAGTVQVKDFGIPGRYQRTIMWTQRVEDTLLFVLQDAVNGTRLWRTDGTASGTRLLKRLDASADVALFPPQVVDGTVVFTLTDEGPSLEVWKTDGTEAGTLRLDAFGRDGQLLGVAGGFATVLTRTEDGHSKLWRLPMAGGPKQGVAVLPNPYSDDPKAVPGLRNAVTVDGRIYFARTLGATVQTPRDVDLWVTDGTAEGTRQLSSGLTRPDVFHSPLFGLDSGGLLFSAKGNVWVTDGTVQGTHAVDSLTANKTPAEAAAFTRVGGQVFFRALPGAPGFSLWAIPLSQ
ncbi:hypothetical protein D7Y21_23870 [Corallococcus sp. AB045]|uniref:hypothetical protein n=1 Tax=Corallococcus sp. AB045 TaxID=2316719 RepID=UPI000EE24F19|nr:hypothetical protein [Corallococcus sp. AB045]RKH84919.1 hypothetical protein D7Y21_23870 [Corallococcus sp. AB045]